MVQIFITDVQISQKDPGREISRGSEQQFPSQMCAMMSMAMLVPFVVTGECHDVTVELFIGIHVMVFYCYAAQDKGTVME